MSTTNEEIVFGRLESLLKGRSVTQFAKDCGIKQQSMNNYIRKLRTPTIENLGKICKTNGVSSDWLIGITDIPNGMTDDKDLLKRCISAEQQLRQVNTALRLILQGAGVLQAIVEDDQGK